MTDDFASASPTTELASANPRTDFTSANPRTDFAVMTPRKIVEELDRYIVGQEKAKRAVAIALRNRMRRQRLPADIRDEIAPKNILMIGPTGVGKTEIARRLAKLCQAPFIKVEATKYTEVGYVGRDVESMIRDLMAAGLAMVKSEMQTGVKEEADRRAEERLLDLLLPGIKRPEDAANAATAQAALAQIAGAQGTDAGSAAVTNDSREKFRALLRAGKLDAREVEITVQGSSPAIEIFSGNQMEEMEVALGGLSGLFGGKRKKKAVSVAEARRVFAAEELDKLVDPERAAEEARRRVQETGIVFIDEIDKIANREGRSSGGVDVSREGVQRDILPIVEGSTVNTKWGTVDTSHILFIAAGAFNVSKPQDLIPELQGRFPIRVELEALSAKDFERILTEPKSALVKQYIQLLSSEGVELEFDEPAVSRIAEIAAAANARTENIGARRLATVMERLLEELSFEAPSMAGVKVSVDVPYVDSRFKDFAERQDLSRYIL
jgi:ATP-dependent HslUV protease ATP-binding subunit HslU